MSGRKTVFGNGMGGRLVFGLIFAGLLSSASVQAGPLRDRLAERRAAAEAEAEAAALEGGDEAVAAGSLPAGVRVLRDLAYGADARQRMDVYLPAGGPGREARVLFMVHGGAWRLGDKAASRVVENKLARWVPKGDVLVSVNYRMLPGTPPLEQARDVAAALARAQALAPSWGADPAAFVLMGHSAGAHLVALLASDPAFAREAGAQPWLGMISLDSAALDVVRIMEAPHARLYDRAFGESAAGWPVVSPYHRLAGAPQPMLLVCSSRRAVACDQAERYAMRVGALGGRAQVLPQPLSHGDINARLGEPGAYTEAVEAFLATLGRGR